MSVHNARTLSESGSYRHVCLYFILCENVDMVHIKIGVSRSPIERAGTLKTGCPLPMKLLGYASIGTMRRAMQAERALHERLAQWKIQGEWFGLPVSMAAEFRSIARQTVESYASPSMDCAIQVIDIAEYFRQAKGRSYAYLSRVRRMSIGVRAAITQAKGIRGC